MNFAPLSDEEISSVENDSLLENKGESCQTAPIPQDAPSPPSIHPSYGKVVERWAYTNVDGKVVFYCCRFETKNGKKVLPQTYAEDGWQWRAIPDKRCLYGLAALKDNENACVVIVEGEKCAEAAKIIFPDCVVSTSSGGANAASKSDWSLIKNRRVIIWRDNDKAGLHYQNTVAQILIPQGCSVEILDVEKLASLLPDGSQREPLSRWDCADAVMEWSDLDALRAAITTVTHPFGSQPVKNCKNQQKLAISLDSKANGCAESFLPNAKNSKNKSKKNQQDQLQLAQVVIDTIGPENIIYTVSGIYIWDHHGKWLEHTDISLRKTVQTALHDIGIKITSSLIKAVTEVLKTEIYKSCHSFNVGNPESVNCINGEIELDEGRWALRPHRKELYRTTQIPISYIQQAEARKFLKFLDEIFLDDEDKKEKIHALLELMGYTLMSHARHEKFVILVGAGANGKSVLLSIIQSLCGDDNVAAVQPSNFDRSFQRAHLHNKHANIITEIPQGSMIADAELKAITSGEPSTVEHKYGKPFVMQPFCTCWFGTNHMPQSKDYSEALFRRAIIITFNRVFSTKEQNPNLKEELKEELPGILVLALEAYARALQNGFTEPRSSRHAKNEWRLEVDQVAQFVNELCEKDPKAELDIDKIYFRYEHWANSEGITRQLGKKGLRQRLAKLGFGNRRSSENRYVTGIAFKDKGWPPF